MKEKQFSKSAQRWAAPVLVYRGTVGEVLKGGEGKITTSAYDPGEQKCPPSGDKCG